jgi:lysozyme family protein
MPMEVFTISGPALGYDAVSQAIAIDRARAAAARGGSLAPAASASASSGSATPACQLQTALKALGAAAGDGPLNIATDGAIGPGTVKALNLALSKYIGAQNVQSAALSAVAGGRFMNATATKGDVQQYAGTLATLVSDAVKNAGGTVPAAVCSRAVSKSKNPFATSPSSGGSPDASDHSMMQPQLVWILGGGALIVLALGFMAARKSTA